MRRLNITLDEETDNLLKGKTNQADTVREAIRMYHGGITTDKLAGMQAAFVQLRKQNLILQKEVAELQEAVNDRLDWVIEQQEKLLTKFPDQPFQ